MICREKGTEVPETLRLGGVRFAAVSVRREGLLARRDARRAARMLARRGVRQALFPEGYPLAEAFAARGVEPVSPVPLYRASGAAILRCALAQEGICAGRATVCVSARRAEGVVEQAAISMAESVRYLDLQIAVGAEALARRLRREQGVSPRLYGPHETPRSDVTVCFDAPETDGDGLVLRLYDPALPVVFSCPEELRAAARDYPLLSAALYLSGALRPETLTVRAVGDTRSKMLDKRGGNPYNICANMD